MYLVLVFMTTMNAKNCKIAKHTSATYNMYWIFVHYKRSSDNIPFRREYISAVDTHILFVMFSIKLCSFSTLVIIIGCLDGAVGLTNSRFALFRQFPCVVEVIGVFGGNQNRFTACLIHRKFIVSVAHTFRYSDCFYVLNGHEIYFGNIVHTLEGIDLNFPPLEKDIAVGQLQHSIPDGSSMIPAIICQDCVPQVGQAMQAVVTESLLPTPVYTCDETPTYIPTLKHLEYINGKVVSNSDGFRNFPSFTSNYTSNRPDIFFLLGDHNQTAEGGNSGGALLDTIIINGIETLRYRGSISFGSDNTRLSLPIGCSNGQHYHQWFVDVINAYG